METVNFNPNGGPLSVFASSGVANPGHYELFILEPNATTVVQRIRATPFGAPATNTHALPGNATKQVGRFLHFLTSIGLLDPSKAFAVSLTVLQDGKVLGSPKVSGTGSGVTKESELLVKLAASQPALLTEAAALSVSTRGRRARSKPARRSKRRVGLKTRTVTTLSRLGLSSTRKTSSRGRRTRGGHK